MYLPAYNAYCNIAVSHILDARMGREVLKSTKIKRKIKVIQYHSVVCNNSSMILRETLVTSFSNFGAVLCNADTYSKWRVIQINAHSWQMADTII